MGLRLSLLGLVLCLTTSVEVVAAGEVSVVMLPEKPKPFVPPTPDDWAQVQAACKDYLAVFGQTPTGSYLEAFEKKLKGRVETKLVDSQRAMGEDEALRLIAFDWLADNRKKLEQKDPSKILEACCYYWHFLVNHIDFPSQVVENFSSEQSQHLVQYLKQQIAAKLAGGDPQKTVAK